MIETVDTTVFISWGVKIFGLAFATLYIAFALILMNQMKVMKKALAVDDKGWLLFFAHVQLFLGIFLLIYAIIFL